VIVGEVCELCLVVWLEDGVEFEEKVGLGDVELGDDEVEDELDEVKGADCIFVCADPVILVFVALTAEFVGLVLFANLVIVILVRTVLSCR
jgi:hypothetical protein